MQDCTKVNYEPGRSCPAHGKPFRKLYTFGSSMSAETEVYTFHGCPCAVSVKHDPVGILRASVMYHRTYAGAAGRGRLHAMDAAARYA